MRRLGLWLVCMLGVGCGRIAFDPVANDATCAQVYELLPAMLYADAEAACASRGAYMVTIDTEAENSLVRNMFATTASVYLGYTDRANEGTFVWSGPPSTTDVMHWASGQPNDGQTGGFSEDCASMRADGDWYDQDCVRELEPAVCECH